MPFFLHLIYDFRFRRKADCSEIQIMHCSYFFLEFEGKSPGPILHCKKTTKIQVPGARYKTLTHSSLLGTTCTPEHHLITDVQDTESLRKSSTIIHDKLPRLLPASADVGLHCTCSGAHTVFSREVSTLSKPSTMFIGIRIPQDLAIGTTRCHSACIVSRPLPGNKGNFVTSTNSSMQPK
jgi:hypothetical protein